MIIEETSTMSPYLRRNNSFQCTSIEISPHKQQQRRDMPDPSSRVEGRLCDILQRKRRFALPLLKCFCDLTCSFLSSIGISYGGKTSVRLQGLTDLQQYLAAKDGHSLHALEQGADRMLAWQLTQHLNAEPKEKEIIQLILKCLELLWMQCPADRLLQSARDLIDVLPWLVHSWQSDKYKAFARMTRVSWNLC